MPLAGFRDIAGNRVPLAEIDYVRDAARFNCSPATLAILIDSAKARDGVDFSASQLSTTPRQHVLRSMDYYPTTGQAMSAHLGTLKHQQINVQRDRLIVEERFVSKRDPRISGQIDHAAIVELTDDKTLVVDLFDLKTTKWFSTTLIAKDVWRHHPDYAWQLNLCAVLMEEKYARLSDEQWACMAWAAPFGLSSRSLCNNPFRELRVRNLYLECIPADSSYKHEEEARKLGLPEHQKVLVQIERKSAEETYAVYFEAMRLRDEAIKAGYAPICSDRWSNRSVQDLRCRFYCDVAEECKAFSLERGEYHPLASTEQLLTASIKQAEITQ